eukprot:NODE_1392_length_888_cov_116.713945_g1149_i0.p1 GENE.NODE_1392_length_888_cov_116.713945_g1149_i0~~NODE_1392_length_888_cov_116.713945_g1149_i0.p1  ORF type:complete len:122 (+),score=15.14 NODE_1392_length_888_cov_116.713945_g1149_i0:90-455(+)
MEAQAPKAGQQALATSPSAGWAADQGKRGSHGGGGTAACTPSHHGASQCYQVHSADSITAWPLPHPVHQQHPHVLWYQRRVHGGRRGTTRLKHSLRVWWVVGSQRIEGSDCLSKTQVRAKT